MPSNKFEWLNRVKTVEREHTAVRCATDFLLSAAQQDSSILARSLRVRDVEEAVGKLEGTYVVRLFAEFETSLRLPIDPIRIAVARRYLCIFLNFLPLEW